MSRPKSIKTKPRRPHAWMDRPGQLTDRQLAVLTYVRRYWQTFRCAPSVRETCAAFGMVSPQGAQRHFNALVKKGALAHLVCGLGFARGYELTALGLEVTAQQDLSPLPAPALRRSRGGRLRVYAAG